MASVHHRRYCIKHIQLIHWCAICTKSILQQVFPIRFQYLIVHFGVVLLLLFSHLLPTSALRFSIGVFKKIFFTRMFCTHNLTRFSCQKHFSLIIIVIYYTWCYTLHLFSCFFSPLMLFVTRFFFFALIDIKHLNKLDCDWNCALLNLKNWKENKFTRSYRYCSGFLIIF